MHPSFKKLPSLPLQIIEQSILSSPTLNNAELVICLNELLCPFIYSKFWSWHRFSITADLIPRTSNWMKKLPWALCYCDICKICLVMHMRFLSLKSSHLREGAQTGEGKMPLVASSTKLAQLRSEHWVFSIIHVIQMLSAIIIRKLEVLQQTA